MLFYAHKATFKNIAVYWIMGLFKIQDYDLQTDIYCPVFVNISLSLSSSIRVQK